MAAGSWSPSIAAIALLASAGCAASSMEVTRGSALCIEEAAQGLVGKTKPSDSEAMGLTGATIVRQIAPGQPVTEDYRENRVTIETDPATGRVVRAACG